MAVAAAWPIWAVSAGAVLGGIVRPFGWPEWVWAIAGVAALVALRLLTPMDAWLGLMSGVDVLLILTGMMLLSEVARQHGLFTWLAAYAVAKARGSAARLFTIIYAVGIAVTVLLSNDATAVVLTPAVAAAARSAGVRSPLPYLFACAFVANAASFVLPISNPANLVVYGSHLPPLAQWLRLFSVPSVLAIGMTYAVLRWSQRADLVQGIAPSIDRPHLARSGRWAAAGLLAGPPYYSGRQHSGYRLAHPRLGRP